MMKLSLERASTLIAPFDVAVVNESPSTVYGVGDDLRIVYLNRAWRAFANANGASWHDVEWGIGSRIMDATPEPLRPFYESLFARALRDRVIVEHEYECSSPTLLRRFLMRVHPCDSGVLLIVNSRLREEPHTRACGARDVRLYQQEDGAITQCSHCRCVQRVDGSEEWDWLPGYVDWPPLTISHGLCAMCADYHYPGYKDL